MTTSPQETTHATTWDTARGTTGRRRKVRLAAVAGAVLAALAVWSVAEFGFGIDLRAPASGAQGSHDVAAVNVIVASLVASLAGWALLAALERWTPRARRTWTAIAALALVASLAGPLSGSGITAGNRAWLAAMHVVVGAVLITVLSRTSANRERS